ncbi:MAG: biotin--[acetyl-CoA-carboxylase] ligase [Angelakisella sp.]
MTGFGDTLQSRLLTLLLSHREVAVSGEALSESLGVTRAAVWKEIAALRSKGYVIEAATNRGYRLTKVPDLLVPELVSAAMEAGSDNKIVCLPSTDSTILHANRMILEGAGDGTVVLAEHQTNGMGRLGRSFESPGGEGIYLSIILEPRCGTEALGLLTSYAGLAVCEAIEKVCGIQAKIKWPNDIIIDGRKVCGILTRLVSDAETATITHAIVGIGVNVRQQSFSAELSQKAISLRQATGVDYPRAVLTGEIVNSINRMLRTERWLEQPPSHALAALRERSCTLGQQVTVISPTKTREGFAESIDSSGGLVVRFGEERETVSSGEVSVHGVLGYAP